VIFITRVFVGYEEKCPLETQLTAAIILKLRSVAKQCNPWNVIFSCNHTIARQPLNVFNTGWNNMQSEFAGTFSFWVSCGYIFYFSRLESNSWTSEIGIQNKQVEGHFRWDCGLKASIRHKIETQPSIFFRSATSIRVLVFFSRFHRSLSK